METLTIKSPADLLSFIGHTLGFWPQESLVCITVDTNRLGATLRVDHPRHDGGELGYAERSPATSPTTQTPRPSSSLSRPQHPGTPASRNPARRSSPRSPAYWPNAASPSGKGCSGTRHSANTTATQTSAINAKFIYRGSSVEETDRIMLPAPTIATAKSAAVENQMKTIRTMPAGEAVGQAQKLWAGMLDAKNYPTDDQIITLIANFQFAGIRDQLIAAIPGIKEPVEQVLFAQTHGKPQWHRVEWAQQLLLHAHTRTTTRHAAPLLTALGYINWWEGRGSKAHQFLQLALEADPDYRLARLSDQMIGSGMIAGWNTDKNTAYRPQGLEGP